MPAKIIRFPSFVLSCLCCSKNPVIREYNRPIIFDTTYLLIHKLYFPGENYHGTEKTIEQGKKKWSYRKIFSGPREQLENESECIIADTCNHNQENDRSFSYDHDSIQTKIMIVMSPVGKPGSISTDNCEVKIIN